MRDCARRYKGGLRVRFNPSTFNHGDAGLAGRILPDSIRINDEQDAVVGDMQVYKSYPHADYLFEIAETAPDNFGLSIEFNGLTEEIDGKRYARCEEIFAATIVDLPAANPTGLFADAEAKKPYGDVEYADPGYQEDGQHRYPIDTEEHVRAAWAYINQKKNASQYSAEDLKKVKDRIKAAAKKFGIEIAEDNKKEGMSMTDDQVKTLGEQIVAGLLPAIEKLRAAMGIDDDSDPTEEEMDAAGCTDDMTDEEKKAKVMEWRSEADKPLTKRDLLTFFRFSGGPPARVSGPVDDKEKSGDGKFESLVTEFRRKNEGADVATAILAVRRINPEAYNDYCMRGRPDIAAEKK